MNEDIHKWTEGRYTLMFDEHTFFVWDNENKKQMTALQVTKKLNEQQSIIQKEKGEKINAEEKLSYMIWKYNKLKQKNFDLQMKLSEVKENERLRHLKVLANAFIVEKGLEGEFIKWSKENKINCSKKDRGD